MSVATTDPFANWTVGRMVPMPTRLPHGWKVERLTDVARLESGHTPSRRRPDYWGGDVPWVSLNDIAALSEPSIATTIEKITQLGLANSSARLLPAGTVIFSRTASVGKSTILSIPMSTTQDFANYVCGSEIHNQYLMWLFRFLQSTWKQLMAGSIHNTIYMPVFKSLQVLLPPLPEQQAIAKALIDADELIAALEVLITKKRDIKQGVMQELLTGKRRLPGFQAEWGTKTLSELATVDGDNLGASTSADYTFNYISLEDVDVGVLISYSEQQFATAPSRARRRLIKGDVLVSTVRPNLKSHLLFKKSGGEWVCSTGFSVVRANEALLSPEFLIQYLFSNGIESQIEMLLVGSNYPAINSLDVKRLRIPAPDINEQRAIAAVLTDMGAEIAALEGKLAKARAVKQGMMQVLLTGEVRLV
jgi:type I restriction enzyme S subunit